MTTQSQINSIANREFGQTSTPNTIPATYYVGLLLASPNPDGSGVVEVSTGGTAYARQALVNSKSALSTAVNGAVSNISAINFPAATASWGTITDVGIFSALTGGTLLYSSPQAVQKAFDVGDVAFFDVGDIKWTVQNVTT